MAGRDSYAFVSGGGLRLKGTVSKVEKKRKKKPKVAASSNRQAVSLSSEQQNLNSSHHDSEHLKPALDILADLRTESEKKFDEIKRKRMEKVLSKKASLSHREAVDEYNKYLSSLSEHHDMPKIGPG
ncbi:uncharacterized protein V1516DRAFT_129960 [Lipomyces oligophaga]|uniref:uncharacterized protein n=1 Tax=Lipomyces oligophaga TaxID=45792 RepID=UPI0034CF1A12